METHYIVYVRYIITHSFLSGTSQFDKHISGGGNAHVVTNWMET